MMKKRILLVDDEPDLVEMLKMRLEVENLEVEVAFNGREGLGEFLKASVQDHPFDLIILDIMMPGMSGTEVLETIRQDEERRGIHLGKGVPIIMLTALKQPCLDSFNKGCDDYMIKPFDDRVLIAKIKEKLRLNQKPESKSTVQVSA